MGTDNPQPHIEIFAGEEIAGDMDAEHARGVGRVKIPGEIGFKTEEIILGEGEIFRISIADAGAEAFQLAGIAAFAEASFSGGRGTGRTGRQRKRRDCSHLRIAGADMHGKFIHLSKLLMG